MKLTNKIRILTNCGKSDSELKLINRTLLFLSILIIFTLLPISSNAQSWLEEYNFRRALTVTNSGASTTDYQVRIKLTSSNFIGNYPRANGEDIRITSADGTTLLPFWIESWSSNQGVIWAKIPSVPAGTSTIYLYYGNNLVTTASNGTNTFNLFEDNWIINPVQVSSQASWETSITYPMVFKEGSTYNMLYDGHGFYEAKGLATSSDLINWTAYANNPVIGFDAAHVDHGGNGQYAWGDVIKVGSTYHMYPSQGPGTTVNAQSTDLINWTGFTPLTTTDPLGIGTGAAILKEADGITPVQTSDGRYWMVYNHGSSPGPIYLAFSFNLIHWFNANSNNPFLTGNTAGWDSTLFSPSFIKIDNTYYIYYQGYKSNSNWQIGFASASATGNPNTVTWTKYAGNPVISGNHGWDNPIAIDPEFRNFDGTYYLFYTGGNATNGFATSTSPEGPWSQSSNTWVKGYYGGMPTSSGGTIILDSAQNIQTQLSYSYNNALGFRGNFHNDNTGYKWAGFINGQNAPYLIYQVDNAQSYLTFIANHHIGGTRTTTDVGTAALTGFHNFEINWLSTEAQAIIDGEYASFIFDSPPLPPGALPINLANGDNPNTTLIVDWVYLRKFSSPDPTITTVGAETGNPLSVQIKVFLEGPYNGAGGMGTSLNAIIPLNSNDAYSTSTYGYTASTVGSIPNATIVDWVLVELRTGTASGTKVATRAGFLKSDGTIVDINGTSPLLFNGVGDGNYYVVVRHRNHLAIMSATAILLNSSSPLYSFSTSQSQAYGTNPMIALSGGGFGMIAADGNRDGGIYGEDYILYQTSQGGEGYLFEDYSLDGGVYGEDYILYQLNQGFETNVP